MTVINSRNTKKGNDSELDGIQQIKKTKCQEKNSLATENNIRQFWEEREEENITGTGISRDHTMKIRPHPGATNIDKWLYKARIMSPAQYHHFTLWNKLYSEWDKHTKEIREVTERNSRIWHTQNKPQVVISSLMKRFDQDFNEDIRNNTFKGLSFIDNSSIDEICPNRSKLQLNRRGLSFLVKHFKKFVSFL